MSDTKFIKAILIDVDNNVIKEVQIESVNGSTYQPLKKYVQGMIGCFTWFDNDFWYNDEFSYIFENDDKVKGRWTSAYGEMNQWIVGNSVVMCTDENGEACDTTMTVEQVKDIVTMIATAERG